MPGTARPRPRLETAALLVASVAVYSDMYITQPILPLLSAQFGLSPARAGLSVSAVVLCIAIGSTFVGPLSDALGRKRVMVGSAFALAVPTLLCGFARSFEELLALRALQGFCIPGVTAVSIAYAGDHVERARLPAVVGAVIAAGVLGGLTGRVGSGLVTAAFGWRAAFFTFAATTVLAAALLARGLSGERTGERVGWMRAYGGMLRHLLDRRLVGAFTIGFSLFFGFIGIFTYLPYLLSAPPYRLGTARISGAYLVYLAGVVVSPISGRLSGRYPPRLIMGVGLVVAVAGMLLSTVPSLLAIGVALVVLCFGMFTTQAIAPSFVNANAATAKGGANALYLASYYVGGTFGSSLPGLAWQAWRWPGVVGCCVASVSLGLLADVVLCGGARPRLPTEARSPA